MTGIKYSKLLQRVHNIRKVCKVRFVQALGSLPEGDSGVVIADSARPTVTVRVSDGRRVVEHRDVADVLSAAGLTGVPRRLQASGPQWLCAVLRATVLLTGRYRVVGPRALVQAWGALLMVTEGVYYAGARRSPAWSRARLAPAHPSIGMAKIRVAQR